MEERSAIIAWLHKFKDELMGKCFDSEDEIETQDFGSGVAWVTFISQSIERGDHLLPSPPREEG